MARLVQRAGASAHGKTRLALVCAVIALAGRVAALFVPAMPVPQPAL
ncbi:hypothetical protein KQH60_05295 [Mycetohabitans sp. B8]|nr:hypothetical protein [Mycetohabitans sp. B8]MCG1042016.1 hypothetical protein [Mycetohabitans sp. B8]